AARQEERDKAILKERKDSTFDVETDVRFTAGRSFENYEKFAPYVLSALTVVIISVLLSLFWRQWGVRLETPVPKSSLQIAFINAILMFGGTFAGAFCIGQSRDKTFRWLRTVGSWLIAGAVVSLIGVISAMSYSYGKTEVDGILARVILIFFIVLDFELVINFVTEFYRPRTIEEVRPVYESRILALFTEPGGVMRNISDTLDYQFGFKISKTSLYIFIERAIIPMVLLWLLILWVFTGFYEIKHNEVGFLEVFGKASERVYEPGVYFRWPYPIGRMNTVSCDIIHKVRVGAELEVKDGELVQPRVIVWTKEHYKKERDYMVAVQRRDDKEQITTGAVSMLGASIPIDFTIKKSQVWDYLYGNIDPSLMVKNISDQVITKYFCSVDLFGVMSIGREKTSQDLIRLIQQSCDEHNLGVNIVAVNLQDVHPPVKDVAPAFQDVVNAKENMHTEILKAEAYEIETIPLAQSEAVKIVSDADAYRYNVQVVAAAEAERFTKQLLSYQILPNLFKLRTYLDMLEQDGGKARKYIFSNSLSREVYEINLEEKTRLDLLDADLGNIAR
ncbi:MAG: protease modulator HflK, partial [Victivallales bacterium]|nr:protease modulator HflK [Victivallales bacterium]